MKTRITKIITLLFVFISSFAFAQPALDFGTGDASGNSVGFQSNSMTISSTTNMPAGTYNFVDFTIDPGVTVNVTGSGAPLIIRCTGTATINGILSAAGGDGGNGASAPSTGGASGLGGGGWGAAGAFGQPCTTAANVPGTNFGGSSFGTSTGRGAGGTGGGAGINGAGGGGGGAGYGTAGTAGNASGSSAAGGAGGTLYGTSNLTTTMLSSVFLGGSGGGGGGGKASATTTLQSSGGGGGGGGGAVQLAATTLTFGVSGLVTVKGGNGGLGSTASTVPGSTSGSGGGGGGSGGTINLQYTTSTNGISAGTTPTSFTNIAGGTGLAGGLSTGTGTSAGGKGGNAAVGRYLAQQGSPLGCSGTPAPGNTISTANPVLSGASFTLSLQNSTSGAGVTYQWQSAPDVSGVPGTWSNISLATTATLATSQLAITWYRCAVTCSGNGTGLSSELRVTLTYCPVTSTCTVDRIENFVLNTLSNNSGTTCPTSPAGYTLYPPSPANLTTTLVQATSYNAIVRGINGMNTNGWGAAIWIDYNDNYVFEASEKYDFGAAKAGVGGTVASDTTIVINVPANAPAGDHRLRVRVGRNANSNTLDACAAITNGESEDYTITIVAGTPCTAFGNPDPGATLSSLNYVCAGTNISFSLQNTVPGTGLSYQWQSSPVSDFSSGVVSLGTATTQQITAPAADTYYRCLVSCSGGGSAFSTPILLTIRPFNICTVCVPGTSACTNSNTIQNVTFDGINHTASICGPNGYNDYRDTPHANVVVGNTYPLSITIGTTANFSAAAYIDWNQNGLLTDAGESYSIPVTLIGSSWFGSVNILVPPGTPSGVAVLRIRARANGVPQGPCNNMTSGSTRDYLIDITQAPACSGTPNPGNTISSLPVCSGVNFTLSLQNLSYATGITYQWQSAPDVAGVPGTWSNTAGTSYTFTTSQTVITWYRCIVNCALGGQGISTPVQALLGGTAECAPYCIPSHANNINPCNNGVVSKVTFNTLSYTPACYATLPPAYALIPPIDSATTTLTPAATYQLKVITLPGQGASVISAWIDWNRDTVFQTTEWYSLTSNVALNVSVPSSFPGGNVRMRINTTLGNGGDQPNGAVDACRTDFLYGETIDFILTMLQPDNCIGTPTPGNTISSANNFCSSLGFTLSLQNSTTGTGVSYQWQTAPDIAGVPGTWVNAGSTATTFTTTTASTSWYRCEVTCTASGISATSNPVRVIVFPCVFMSNGSATTCNIKFYDSGGPSAGYGLSQNLVYTFNPDAPNNVARVTFNSFALNSLIGGDFFTIYNGPDTLSPKLLNSYSGNSPGGPYTATLANGGSLTFKFSSDATSAFDGAGWNADISCLAVPPCAGIPNPGNTVFNGAFVCSSDIFTLTLSNTIPDGVGLLYQWQSAPDVSGAPGSWTDIGPHSSSLSTSQASTTWYRCNVSCSFGGSGTSTPVQVISTPCYCPSVYAQNGCSGGSDLIRNVVLNTLSNNTGTACNTSPLGYSIYGIVPANQTTTLYQGFTHTANITAQSGFTGGWAAAIWIDYNNDGIYDASEKYDNGTTLYGTGNTVAVTASIAINVPALAPAGYHRMRVKMVRSNPSSGNILDPCTTANPSYGETEDYLITVGTPVAPDCAINYFPADNATAVNCDVTIAWAAGSSGAAAPTGYDVYFALGNSNPPLVSADQPGTSYQAGVLVAGGTYYYKIVPRNVAGSASSCPVLSFTIGAVCYCTPAYTAATCGCCSGISISNFTMDISSFNSGCNSSNPQSYSLTSSPVIQATIGQVVPYSVSTPSSSAIGIKIWIDYNDNGSFEDVGELLAVTGLFTGTYSNTFTLPCMPAGVHRLRVRTVSNTTAFTSCDEQTSGETEDYLINVILNPNPGSIGTVSINHVVSCGPSDVVIASVDNYSGALSWQYSIDGGLNWITVPGANTSPVNISITEPANYKFRAIVNCTTASSPLVDYKLDNPDLPPVAAGSNCGPGNVTLQAFPGAGYTVRWYTTPTGGSPVFQGNTFSPNVNSTTDYFAETYSDPNSGGTGCYSSSRAIVTATINHPVAAAATISAPVICAGSQTILNANVTNDPPPVPGDVNYYYITSIPVAPRNPALITNPGPTGNNTGVQAPHPIGFPFTFFGNTYDSIRICSNGNIQFGPDPNYSSSAVPTNFPNAGIPNNLIACPWVDLNPTLGGNITWGTIGFAPNRELVVSFNQTRVNSASTGSLTSQIILKEGSSDIEIHVSSMTSRNAFSKVMGIENADGTIGFMPPNRSLGTWSIPEASPEAWKFHFIPVTQPNTYIYSWQPTNSLSGSVIGTVSGSNSTPNVTGTPSSNQVYTVTMTSTANQCTGTASVSVAVNTAPLITCPPSNLDVPTDLGTCGAIINFAASVTGIPTPSVTYSKNPGTVFSQGPTVVTANANNSCGSASCQFTYIVKDHQNPVINNNNPLQDITASNDPGDCGAILNVNAPSFTDNCAGGNISGVRDDAFQLNDQYPVGITEITWTATDATGINSVTAVQHVIVQDNEQPSISCQANIVQSNAAGQCGKTVTYNSSSAGDNCGAVTLTYSPASGSFFNVGTTPVLVTASDAHGNTSNCFFTVTINDTESPVITCPANTTVNANAANCKATLAGIGSATATDNCAETPVAIVVLSPVLLNLGANTVTWKATDASGNTSTCTQTVTVVNTLSVYAGVDETTYYGYSGDQSVTHTAVATGGVGSKTYSWTMNRPLKCNIINNTGDETFTSGTCTNNLCPGSPLNYTMGSVPLCTGSATLTAALLDSAYICVTATDAIGCTATDCFWIFSEDARCFSGTNAKVQICHRTGPNNNQWVQLCVDSDAIAAHLAHGDYVGKCGNHRMDEIGEEAVMNVNLYPNPNNGNFTVDFNSNNSEDIVVSVSDMLGQIVFNKTISVPDGIFKGVVETGNLENGYYTFRVEQGKEIITKPIVIIR